MLCRRAPPREDSRSSDRRVSQQHGDDGRYCGYDCTTTTTMMEKVCILKEETSDVGDKFILFVNKESRKDSYMPCVFSNERVFHSGLDLKITYVTQTQSSEEWRLQLWNVRASSSCDLQSGSGRSAAEAW